MMIPSIPSNHHLEDGEQPKPDSSKVTSDPKFDGKQKRKKDKARDRYGGSGLPNRHRYFRGDRSATTEEITTTGVERGGNVKEGWKGVSTNLMREVDNFKAALEQARRIRKKDPLIPPTSSSDEENASDINAFDNNVDPMDNQFTPKVGRK